MADSDRGPVFLETQHREKNLKITWSATSHANSGVRQISKNSYWLRISWNSVQSNHQRNNTVVLAANTRNQKHHPKAMQHWQDVNQSVVHREWS